MASLTEQLNVQLGSEFAASQQYVAIAVWYDNETLPQLARHFYRQAVEERNHAMIIVRYLLDARKSVTIPPVNAPQTEFGGPVEPVRLALRQEEEMTEHIQQLAKLARSEGDLVGEQFLTWFLKEQLEEMSSMADLLRTVERAVETNILLAEDYLARTAIGDQGGSPDDAPPAAGGAL
jgi:ferritin